MTEALPRPGSDHSFSRALTVWRRDESADAPFPEHPGERSFDASPRGRLGGFAAYAVAAALVLGVGAAAASLATAPALTDAMDTVAAVDARAMGMAQNLDPTGQQSKTATLNRDVGTMKTEIARLQKALDQSKFSQTALSKAAAGQAADAQGEVKTLKSEIANLQKTLDASREASSSKIEQLSAKVEQSKDDAAHLAELRERLDRVERQAAEKPAVQTAAREPQRDPDITGSIGEQPKRDAGPIVRNWVVREVVRGVALLEGRHGLIEVVRGARAPGMGRVKSIERRDGQWVVVTERGLVLERSEL